VYLRAVENPAAKQPNTFYGFDDRVVRHLR
jgi:hypothetical protein